MSTVAPDNTPIADSPIADEPGAGLEAMRRRTKVAPPPPPKRLPTNPAPAAEQVAAPEPKEAKVPSGVKRTRQAESAKAVRVGTDEEAKLLGQAKGNVRQISTRLPLAVRQQLVAIAQREELSLGEAAMDAVRQHHQALRDRHPPRETADLGFAPPRRRAKRSAAGEKVPTPMSVTPEEAAGLQALADDVSMSVNRVIIECLEAAFGSGEAV